MSISNLPSGSYNIFHNGEFKAHNLVCMRARTVTVEVAVGTDEIEVVVIKI